MAGRINRCIELLAQDQAIYYDGPHSGHVLTHAQGRIDAATWADYMNVGMEHGAFDMTGLAEYMRGMADAGPTRSGHRTPTVIVEAPVNGIDAIHVRTNAWQFRQLLGRGVHGILLCQAESADAVRAFVESCRYPHNTIGVDPRIPSPLARMEGARRATDGGTDSNGRKLLGIGTRGRGSESTAAPVWGLSTEDYMDRCDPWPLNPKGELLLGVKLESPEGIANCSRLSALVLMRPIVQCVIDVGRKPLCEVTPMSEVPVTSTSWITRFVPWTETTPGRSSRPKSPIAGPWQFLSST